MSEAHPQPSPEGVPGAVTDPSGILGHDLVYPGHGADAINAYLAHPVEEAARAGIIVIHEAGGLGEHIRDVVARFANIGYDAIGVDLYTREGGPPPPGDMEALFARLFAMPDERVLGDLVGAAEILRAREDSTGKLGCIGFCMGGRYALLFAAARRELDAAVDCWGGFIDKATPDERSTPSARRRRWSWRPGSRAPSTPRSAKRTTIPRPSSRESSWKPPPRAGTKCRPACSSTPATRSSPTTGLRTGPRPRRGCGRRSCRSSTGTCAPTRGGGPPSYSGAHPAPRGAARTERRPRVERKWWTLIAVSVAIFMLLLDITVVNVALPDIQRSLHSSFSDLQWVVNAYSLTLAAFLLTAGSLADLVGRRRVFVLGLVVFTAASAACGLAGTPLALNLFRAVQGTGGAMMFATSLALIASAFHGPERGLAFGVYGGVIGAAVAVGPVIGGVITQGIGWEWIFFVNVPIGIAAVFLTMSQVQESRDPNARGVDWIGLVTFSGALFTLVFALIKGNEKGWGSTEIVSLLAGVGDPAHDLPDRRAAPGAPDARPVAVQEARVHRREPRRAGDLLLDVLDVPLPDPLRPGRARLRPAAGGSALPADHTGVVHRGADLRQSLACRCRSGC